MTLRVVEHAEATDRGRYREINEDALVVAPPYFAVADGMGGAQAGEVASRVAAEVVREHRRDLPPESLLADIAREANRRIYELAARDERRRGMGTTLTAALVAGDEVAIGHVGDSRAYRFRDGRLEQLTRDHSLVAELQRSGQITPEAAEQHPQRSVITRALGPEPEVEVDTYTVPARDGDVFLLCSDGLTTMLNDGEIEAVLKSSRDLKEAAENLVRAANQSGGRDNITVVLFKLAEEGSSQGAGAEAAQDARSTDDRQADYEHTIVGGLNAAELATRAPREASERVGSVTLSGQEPGPAVAQRRARRAPGRRSSRARPLRRVVATATALLLLAGLFVGGRAAVRSVYFVGTDQSGLIAVYRGLPYELPFGIELYEQEYVSGIPALALPAERRAAVLDHRLRDRSDAIGLVRAIEQGRIEGLDRQ